LEKSLEQLRKILEPQERGRSGALFLLLPLIIALILGIITQRDYLLDLAKQWQASKNPPPAVEVIPEREIYGNREPELFDFPQDSMDFQLDESKILRMNGHDAYSLQARIIPKGTPINQGSLQLRFLQEDSTLLEEKLILLPGANQGTIDPGETLLIDHFDFLDVDPKSIYHITLIMGELDRQESLRGSMEDPLNLTWAIERPGNVNLHLQWKELNYLEAYDRFYYLGELLLENRGSQPLSHLELELQGFGKSFNPLYRSMFNPVNRHSLELLPGEKRPFRIVLDINQQDLQPQNQWNMEITEIELDSTQ
jgi:hypothetical protein